MNSPWKEGPARVLINADGEAIPPYSPRNFPQHNGPAGARYRPGDGGWDDDCDLILIRDDGWTLAAPADLAQAAREMYPKEWVAVWFKGADGPVDLINDCGDFCEAQDCPLTKGAP